MQKASSPAISSSGVGSPSAQAPRLLALVPGGLAFILYLLTCSPTVNFTDSGELLTVAWTGGIAHPPGYPLYTLLGALFIHLLFGEPAWRMNILSALFAALAVGLFYKLVTTTLIGMPAFSRAVARRANRAHRSANPRSGAPGKSEPARSAGAGHSPRSDKHRTMPAPSIREGASQDVIPKEDQPGIMRAAVAGVAALQDARPRLR